MREIYKAVLIWAAELFQSMAVWCTNRARRLVSADLKPGMGLGNTKGKTDG